MNIKLNKTKKKSHISFITYSVSSVIPNTIRFFGQVSIILLIYFYFSEISRK